MIAKMMAHYNKRASLDSAPNYRHGCSDNNRPTYRIKGRRVVYVQYVLPLNPRQEAQYSITLSTSVCVTMSDIPHNITYVHTSTQCIKHEAEWILYFL